MSPTLFCDPSRGPAVFFFDAVLLTASLPRTVEEVERFMAEAKKTK